VESGSTRDTAPPATELITSKKKKKIRLIEFNAKPLMSELTYFILVPLSDNMILAACAGSVSAKLRGRNREASSIRGTPGATTFAR